LNHHAPTPKLLTGALVVSCAVASAIGCGGSAEFDVGQVPGAGASAAGGSLDLGGTSSQTGGRSGAGTNDSPCGVTPCADHSGDKTFVEADTPADAADVFDDATSHEAGSDVGREPAIVYPSHETMFPLNVSHIRHDWVAGQNDLFELRFVGPKTNVTVFTSAQSFTPSDEQWDWIAESNRGGTVELTVSGVDSAAPADAWQSRPISLLFSDGAVEGAIYYWSTGTKGIMRATVSEPLPEKFYTDPSGGDSESCAACHTLSRDGKRLAVGYNGERLREVSVPERETIVPIGGTSVPTTPDPMPKPMPMMPKQPGMGMPTDMGEGMASAWTTFSPDGEMLLVAANGILTLIDSDTGETIGDDAGVVSIPANTVATHPDWAATGDRVAIALGSKGGNKEVEAGSIAILPYDGGAWGEAQVLIPSSDANDNNFFPVWSPDSKYLAYVHAEGQSRDATSAELRLFDVAAGQVISMLRVNQRVNNEDGVMEVGNSMPTWAPSTKPGTFWLAFSSVRAYSIVRPPDDKADQIWIAAIDPSAKDPSYAGFWAPFQSIAEGNHRAFWTHASDDTQCRCVDICGDSLDNDCNGTADESGCSECSAEEICGDGIDNDCDCVIDDCNDEICNDEIDNDGDGNVDRDDPDCQTPK
jgi:Tol biopolymer transport system component